MKYIISLIIISGLIMTKINAQTIDMTVKPEPLPASSFNFPTHTEHTLKNGLKLFIIEDNEQPTVSFRLLVPGGTAQDGKNLGQAELLAGLLTKGAGKRNALDIANTIDGIGASISASAGGDFISVSASGLKKHTSTILEVFTDVIIAPTLPQDEFEKLVRQMIAGLQYEKSQPTRVGSNLARKVIYGNDHPYAIKATEKSVADIKLKDISDYYGKFFVPNHSTLAVIGDVKPQEVIDMLDKSFAGWKKASAPKISFPKPKPMPLGVYFIHRPASEQSTVIVTNMGLPYNHQEYEVLDMSAKIIGSGFGGRLFRTLRETYSYTYSPWGYQTSSKYINRFACGADVNRDKTDASIDVIFEQLRLLGTDGPTEDELERQKRFEVGQYYLSFENSNFVASLIQQSDFMGISLDKVKTYPDRVQSISTNNIEVAAEKYLNPKHSRIIVVGDPSVRESLEKYGKVFDFNLDLEPISGADAKMDKVSLTDKQLIERHQRAIGGENAIANVSSIFATAQVEMQSGGEIMHGEMIQKIKAPNKMYMKMDMKMFVQEVWYDGKSVFAGGLGDIMQLHGRQQEKMALEATPFNTAKLLELGYKVDVKGKQAGQIIAVVNSPEKVETTYYFDENTFLVTKYESVEETPMGLTPITVKFFDWQEIDGVKLPGRIENYSAMFNLISTYKYELNTEIDDDLFIPNK